MLKGSDMKMIPVDKSKLDEKMESRDLKDIDMASNLDVTKGTYSKYMSGQIIISLPTFIKIMNVLEVPDEEIGSFLLRK